ncbi:MAG: hypothetical protein KF685_04365 [Acidobacteria bacterium]|nr:hypothetical protein [Acidobacteriota bacterium]
MYCPRCGQEQFTRETTFCNRCGLRLDQIALVLSNDGSPISGSDTDSKLPSWLYRKNGILFSVLWFMFWLLLVVPLSGAMGIDDLAAFGAVFGFSGGVMLLFVSLFLPKRPPTGRAFLDELKNKPTLINEPVAPRALYDDLHSTATDYIQPAGPNAEGRDTGKLRVPGSVTENTTKLLIRQQKEK